MKMAVTGASKGAAQNSIKNTKCRDTNSDLRLPKGPGLASSAEVFRKVFWVLAEILDALRGDGRRWAGWTHLGEKQPVE